MVVSRPHQLHKVPENNIFHGVRPLVIDFDEWQSLFPCAEAFTNQTRNSLSEIRNLVGGEDRLVLGDAACHVFLPAKCFMGNANKMGCIFNIWALPMWFSKNWDFAKIGISRIFMDFRVLLFGGFQVPMGTWNPYILPEIPIFAQNPQKSAKSQF